MLDNYRYKLILNLRDFCKKFEINYIDLFYKNGNLKNTSTKKIEKQLIKMIENISIEVSYGYMMDFDKTDLIITEDEIIIVYNWENLKFDKNSDYHNIYDFINCYKDDVLIKLRNEIGVYYKLFLVYIQ